MEDFSPYAPEEVILSNLEEVTSRALRCEEQELAHIRELAEQIASEFTDVTSFFTSLSEHRLPEPKLPPELFSASPELCAPIVRTISTRRRILLCMELAKLIPAFRSLWQEFFFPAEEPNRASFNRISYQKNSYTDAAYQRFAALLPEPRASYAHSFPSVCEDVYNGLSEYCILPLENSAEGRLNSFSRLIAEYDMKLAAVCGVQVGEGRVTSFALLRKTAVLLHTHGELPRCFEFSCQLSDYPGSEDILTAARYCGLRLLRADISADGSSSTLFHPVFSTQIGDLPTFLLYLAMEIPSANLIGLYPVLP